MLDSKAATVKVIHNLLVWMKDTFSFNNSAVIFPFRLSLPYSQNVIASLGTTNPVRSKYY